VGTRRDTVTVQGGGEPRVAAVAPRCGRVLPGAWRRRASHHRIAGVAPAAATLHLIPTPTAGDSVSSTSRAMAGEEAVLVDWGVDNAKVPRQVGSCACTLPASHARSTRSTSHLSPNRARVRVQPLVEELPSIVALLAGEDATARLRGITNLRKCTRAEGWVPARVVWEALLPHVVPLAWPGAGAEAVQFEALWTLTNLTSADGWCEQLIPLGVADAALATLQQEVAGLDVREQAVWLLGNLLGEWACAWACVLLPLRGRLCVATLASPHGSWDAPRRRCGHT
jgi:hypothetical protein